MQQEHLVTGGYKQNHNELGSGDKGESKGKVRGGGESEEEEENEKGGAEIGWSCCAGPTGYTIIIIVLIRGLFRDTAGGQAHSKWSKSVLRQERNDKITEVYT